MGKKNKNRNSDFNYRTVNEITRNFGQRWYLHYYRYLCSIAYQMFEWDGLPESVDPRYLEMVLHNKGYVGFFKDPTMGYIVTEGAVSGTLDHYMLPKHFHAVSPVYQKTFPLYHYSDIKDSEHQGIVIWNNDIHDSTLPALELFSHELKQIKEIISVNLNAQKTPVLLLTTDNTQLSIKNIYNQYEGNAPVIIGSDQIDPNMFQVLKTDAPYVVDKLNTQKNALWNEFMTYMGINNANLEKRERMITSEADSNNEQIQSSANVFLKSRQEACNRINELYDLDVSVKLRTDVIEAVVDNIQQNEMTGGDD